MTLTKEDLLAISDLLDQKLEVKLKKELKPIKEDISDLKSDVKVLKDDVQGLKSDVEELKGDVQGLKSDAEILKGDVQGLKSDVKVLKSDVQGLKSDVEVLKGDVQGLKGSVDLINVKVDRNARALRDLDITVRNMKYVGSKKFARLQDGMDTVTEIFRMNDLIPR